MKTQSAPVGRVVVVRMNSGEDVLECLRSAVRENGIRNGVIVSGAGSINRYHVHVVGKPDLPPADLFVKGEGPYDLLTLTGMVLDGRVHAHITFANQEKALGGHLEEGTRILTFGSAVLADTPEIDLAGWDAVGHI